MGFNTFPCNPYPISTNELNKGNNDDLNARVAALESDVSDLDEQKANQITIALSFNPETTYEVGDLVYYNGLSYRCTNEHTGEWDADDFAGTTIANELSVLKSGLTGKQNIYGTAVKIGEIAVSDTIVGVTATKNGYISLVYEMNSVNMDIKGKIRDSDMPQFGVSFDIVAGAYTSEPICVIPCNTGRTYSVEVKAGHNGISVYQF